MPGNIVKKAQILQLVKCSCFSTGGGNAVLSGFRFRSACLFPTSNTETVLVFYWFHTGNFSQDASPRRLVACPMVPMVPRWEGRTSPPQHPNLAVFSPLQPAAGCFALRARGNAGRAGVNWELVSLTSERRKSD